ncbi:MAG: hypothetical protein P4M11_15360 [Candidatus Pacebacteria bacterium]|nr:hypothetical protein [Candidatus Paceibacterota bacterium]
MIFYMLTLVATICFYSILFWTSMNHDSVTSPAFACGPFDSYSKSYDYTVDYLDDVPMYNFWVCEQTAYRLSYVIDAIFFAPLMWLIIFMLSTGLAFSGSTVQLLKKNEELQRADYSKQIEELNNKIKKLQRQLEYNRLSVAN